MAELTSMTDFVLKYAQKSKTGYEAGFKALEGLRLLKNYANFLKTPLSIEQFVPCKLTDGVWEVLEEPDADFYMMVTEHDLKEYKQAKSLCLFEGFEFVEDNQNTWVFKFKNETWFIQKDETIEFLTDMEITLTPAAKKQIGL